MSPSKPRALSFRAKLILALIAAVAPVLIVALLVIRRETNRQITSFLNRALVDSREQLERVEEIRQMQLQRLGTRFGASNRLPGALQQALEGDTAFLASQLTYELELAGVNNVLVAFADLDGNAVLASEQGRILEAPDSALALTALQRLANGDTSAFGYHRLGAHLYSVHPVALHIVTQPVGFLLLGAPIDAQVANEIGDAIDAEVCFVAAGRCLAATRGAARHGLIRYMEAATASAGQRRVQANGSSYAVLSTALPGFDGAVVLALQLDQVLQPFTRIQQAVVIVGGIALLLALALALALGRGLARPINLLVAATERVAAGDYETRVDVRSRDELGQLADAFNDMTYGLLLRDRYKGVLDKVVSRDIANELVKGEIRLGGENREVTTLFADIRGFTPLTEGMEPQQVIGVLNEIMERLSAAVAAEGGVVDKYVGDELMALFGAPLSHGDDAVRAVRAGLRMQRDIAAYNEDRLKRGLLPVRIGLGINTGTVVAGNMGSQKRMNYTVLGAAVNLASRLCSAAQPGQILIGAQTAERVEGAIEFVPLGDRALKGFSGSVAIYEVVASESVIPAGS